MPALSHSSVGRTAWIASIAAVWFGVVAGPTPAWGRDDWLEPAATWAEKGEEVALHLWSGNLFKGEEERPLEKEAVIRFDFFGDRSGRRDLLALGREGQLPVAKTRLEGGAALVVMDRFPRPITMEAARFNAYLAEVGAEPVLAARREAGQLEQPAREEYGRYLKSLIQERDAAAVTPNTLYKRRVGQRLEILLENDPRRLRPDGSLNVKVLFEDRPLAGVKVFAFRRNPDGQLPYVLTAFTDPKGLAAFKLDQAGLWMIRSVYVRAVPASEHHGDSTPPWESSWAAYTFGAHLAVAPPPTGSAPPTTAVRRSDPVEDPAPRPVP